MNVSKSGPSSEPPRLSLRACGDSAAKDASPAASSSSACDRADLDDLVEAARAHVEDAFREASAFADEALDRARDLASRLRDVPDAAREGAAAVITAVVDLPEEPAPPLKRPLVMVHGYMGDAEDYHSMVAWLGRDGVNRSGGVIAGGQPFEADPQANFFVLEFSSRWNPMAQNSAELKAAIDEICRKTGASGVDIVAHSKGGLDTRSYLMNPDEKAERVVLLGTPNHGVAMADVALFAREKLDVEVYPPKADAGADQCLRELSVDTLDRAGVPNNPTLHDLNAAWDLQKERADFFLIAGAGIPTPCEETGLTLMGDALVAERSVALPGVPLQRMWLRQHAMLPFSKETMRSVADFLSEKSAPPSSETP